ncbi:integumentary mucin C.1-like [Mercenaria mercenaria]|uniref:integumentary mucin C.1-like n=1 Tax=Mercenaria mercenaria TaxID=6596 RepID=UPI00234F190B|nr:integumentary mucin C.1-like [Mercenaria mercenaria]
MVDDFEHIDENIRHRYDQYLQDKIDTNDADVNYTESSVLLPWERGLPVCTTSTASTSTTTTKATTTTSTASTGFVVTATSVVTTKRALTGTHTSRKTASTPTTTTTSAGIVVTATSVVTTKRTLADWSWDMKERKLRNVVKEVQAREQEKGHSSLEGEKDRLEQRNKRRGRE